MLRFYFWLFGWLVGWFGYFVWLFWLFLNWWLVALVDLVGWLVVCFRSFGMLVGWLLLLF